MSPDKILHKIQLQIDALAPTLELFVEHTIQPTVSSCEELQKQLSELQETITVYKYLKQNKELSPSFNIHARVSEKEIVAEVVSEPKVEIQETPNVSEIKASISEPLPPLSPELLPEPEKAEAEAPRKFIQVALNDKFRFINELFSQNPSEYGIAIEQLNNSKTWSESEVYLNSLKTLYNWKENSDLVKLLYNTVKKRFD